MTYQAHIRLLLPKFDPRHIEAFMRSEFGTLDSLSTTRFVEEAFLASECVNQGGVEMAELLAKSYGL